MRDGFYFSVQASETHYCTPRVGKGPWTAVEVGYLSERIEAMMEYIDVGPDSDPLDSIYGWVPIDIIETAIEEHGGWRYVRNAFIENYWGQSRGLRCEMTSNDI